MKNSILETSITSNFRFKNLIKFPCQTIQLLLKSPIQSLSKKKKKNLRIKQSNKSLNPTYIKYRSVVIINLKISPKLLSRNARNR